MGVIRLYLALVVIIYHARAGGAYFDGVYAVMLFFVISGFCMALVLNRKYTEANPSRFYVARFLRLWPTYAIVFAVILSISPLPSVPSLGGIFANAYYWFTATTLLGHETLWWFTPVSGDLDLIYVLNGSAGTLSAYTHMQQMWSVGIEICFYLVSPLIARRPKLIAGLLVAGYVVHLVMSAYLPKDNPFLVRSALPYLWIFLLGMIGYHAAQYIAVKPETMSKFALPLIAVTLAVAVLAMPYRRTAADTGIILFAVALVPLFAATKDLKWDRLIGELSYPMYVIHWPLVPFYFKYMDRSPLSVAGYLALTIVLAAAIHILVERPIDRIRQAPMFGSRKRRPTEISALT